ncbi:hypothetical protein GGI20_000320 [Coemansia sp. BCRC 34301]|nr:hypothetical protein GGI20_000320 [Coemansia sp. BCRC 34301]
MSGIEWHIRVKALMESGAEKEFQVNTLSDETVGDFRGRLATTSQVEPQKQRLIFRGRLLVDDAQKLVDAGVSNGSALHMVARATDAHAASTSADRASSRTRGERGAPLPSDDPSANAHQLPFGLTPLAAQVMDQTFHRLRSRGRDASDTLTDPGHGIRHSAFQLPSRVTDGMPQALFDHMQRAVHGVYRDFGANNGGEWIASTADALYYRIDREASPGSSLTEEEFRRGNIQGQDPVSQGSTIDAYLPVPGLVPYDDQQSLRQPEYLSARAQASRAQANELLFEMFESLLPALRRLPGREDYSFSSMSSSHPRYLGQAATNQVAVVGESLSGLGDAFIEFGRSLQSVGSQWQNPSSLQPGAAHSVEQMQDHLHAMRQLITTASVASPFLQTTLAHALPEQTQTASRARGGDVPAATSALLQRPSHQAAILLANHRRTRRLASINLAMDMPRSRPHATFEIEFTMNHMQIPSSSQPTPPHPRQHSTGPASTPTQVVDAGRPAGITALAADLGAGFAQPVPTAAIGSLIEQLRSRVDRVFQESLPGPVAAGTSINRQSSEPRGDQNGDTQTETGPGFAGFVDRLSAIGSQTARSDRSNLSTTTEYGSVLDASSRVPRFFAVNLGSGGVSQILPGFAQPNNPFSIASVFLGTEAGSTASTSRRASMASNTSAALTSDTGGNAGNAPAPAPAFRNLDVATSGPRTGEIRARSESLSLSESGNSAEGATGLPSSGSSKRHKPDEAPCDDDQGSSSGK